MVTVLFLLDIKLIKGVLKMQCKKCGSYAVNHHLHGRDGTEPELCDVCVFGAIVVKDWKLKSLLQAL